MPSDNESLIKVHAKAQRLRKGAKKIVFASLRLCVTFATLRETLLHGQVDLKL
jgi:hypothetical protein